MDPPIRFGVQAGIEADARTVAELARKAEGSGFDGLYASDHPGVSPSPFVLLAAAASATSTLRLGTYVCNTGVREPVQLASDAATLDSLSDGRFVLGLGAGHTPVEWTMEGRAYPAIADRVARFAEMLEVTTRLLAGDVVTFHGQFVNTEDAYLLSPRPVRNTLPVLVGGNGKRLLAVGAPYADVVSLTGLGRTLDDGHRHAVDWSPRAIGERVDLIRQAAPDRSGVALDALVQAVIITGDTRTAAEAVAGRVAGLSSADVLSSPYALIGSVDQIVDELRHHHEQWGFTSYVVRDSAVDDIASVIARLAS